MKNKCISISYLGVPDRFQIQMRSREEVIDKENVVRFVDAFVAQLEDLTNKAILIGEL
jgi:hypothetical protein